MNNNFENNMNETQFEDMRQQLNTLKKKLGEQEIVNDRLIRRSMKQEANKISRRYNIIIALCILMIPYTYVVFRMNLGLSLAFWIGTSIFMLICAGATYYNSQNVTNANMMSKNLIEVGQKMARAKKFDANWLFFGIPAVIVWLACLVWELYQQDADTATGASPIEPNLTPDGAIAEKPDDLQAMLQAGFGGGVVFSEVDE